MRKYNFDTLKGILILLVVFAHMLITYNYYPIKDYNIIINTIYIFHMPLFFIISGYFSRKHNNKKILLYFVIFIFMQASFILFDYLYYGKFNYLSIKYSSWFILILALYRLITSNKIIINLVNKKYSIVVLFIISILSGYIFKNLTIVRLFTFYYFFALGFRNKIYVKKKYCYFLLIISIIFIYYIVNLNMSLDFFMGSCYIDNYESIIRMFVLLTDTLLFISIIGLLPDKKIALFSNLGKNSLYIYVFHRIPVLLLNKIFYPYNNYIYLSIIISLIICLLINYLSTYLKYLFKTIILVPISLLCLIYPLFDYNFNHELNVKKQSLIDDSISIGFVGDLILLEDQLKLSNNNFDYMFDNLKDAFNNTDYVFGVLEGPVDDGNDYSYGNYSDNKKTRLNYPSSFLSSIEKSGIDFVSISNNHILDSGIESYNNTIINLNNSSLDYTGTKNNYKIIDIKGIKVGVLAYTYGLNYLSNNDYLDYTNYLTEPYSHDFKKVKNRIHKDFMKLKDSNVDLIIVMPHYGTQFTNKVDTYQEVWNRFFIDEGADIILGDHSHAIQPIEYKKNSIIINSPGNYINSYTEFNGDISMYVKIFINKETYKIIGSSVTPIIAEKDLDGKYYPVLLTNATNKTRVKKLFENTIFKNKINEYKNTYYYFKNDSYKYDNKYRLVLNDNDKNSFIYQKISEHDNICFIGDSITEGTKNNYYPWYIPLINNFNKNIINISRGSYTSYDILDNFSVTIKNSNCDLSIINIGTNDIRYNKENVYNYINNIKKIIDLTNGEVILIAPWQTTNRDYNINKYDKEKRELYNVYNEELKKIDNTYYIDPNPYIKKVIDYNGEDNYILDGVHPNNDLGIKLYSFSVLRGINK